MLLKSLSYLDVHPPIFEINTYLKLYWTSFFPKTTALGVQATFLKKYTAIISCSQIYVQYRRSSAAHSHQILLPSLLSSLLLTQLLSKQNCILFLYSAFFYLLELHLYKGFFLTYVILGLIFNSKINKYHLPTPKYIIWAHIIIHYIHTYCIL